MAAKPPKPPATFLKQSSHNNSNKNDDASVADSNGNSKNEASTSTVLEAGTASATPTSTPPNVEKYSKLGIRRYNSRDNLLNYVSNDNESETTAAAAAAAGSSSAEGATAVQRPTCNCTNISIMHLFHEMKQEFPTIPDPIVAQCVNENCHQRENCIQMLRNELALNPIPVQTYPAKVLQQLNINQQHNNHQLQQQQQQQKQQQQQQPRKNSLRTPPHPEPPQRQKNASPQKPPTPLRPIRAAPTTPPQLPTPARIRAGANSSGSVTPPNQCDSVELVQNNNNRNLLKDVQSAQSAQCYNQCIDNKSNSDNSNNTNNNSSVSESSSKKTCDMPAAATANAPANASVDCARSSDFIAQLNRVATNPVPPPSSTQLGALGQRARPNTLNLQASQQQLQRQQLNKQLQQHLQQRSQLKHQLQQQQQQQDLPLQKPIRKAPLPPIAPKPVFHNNIGYNNNNNGNNNNSCGNSPQSQSGASYSTESNLASPISSCSGENEISNNIVSSSAQAFAHRQNNNTPASTVPTYQSAQPQPQTPSSPLRSPIRHRSVINVQPEPPYTRDFLPAAKIGTSTATSPATGGSGGGSGASTPTSQKSFTSVNLTLRQPTAAVPQSTIDISAGPVLSGHGSGLTYSSTSYNARHGFKQNFHITVTEEGGVFNASRIGPRNSGYYAGIEESDNPGGPTGGSDQTTSVTQYQQTPTTALRSPTTQQQQHQQGIQNITPQAIQAAATTTTGGEEMCLPLENSVFIETIKRQKTRRDKLATALRENKKKIGDVEEEINMLTEPLNPSESSRLDYEIERLRSDCQQMLNEIENIRRYGQLSEADRLKLQQQQQQQAFLRQRPPRPPPPILQQQQQPQSPYQYPPTEQHHNTPGSGSSSLHSSTPCTPLHLQQSPHYNQTTGHTAPAPLPYQQLSTDEEDYSDSNTDGGDDYEPLERWACSMCTFLNHPQLNICETCECVRVIPGTIRIKPNAGACGGVGVAAAAIGGAPATVAAAVPAHGAVMRHNSATAAAAAAALTAATPTAIAHGSGSPSVSNSPTSAARTVAAE